MKKNIEFPNEKELRELEKEKNLQNCLLEDEPIDLIKKAKLDDKEAKELLIEHYIAFITQYVKTRYSKLISVEDSIQDACIGLLQATKYFDFDKNVKFITYATWWMKNEINRGIKNQNSNVKLSFNTQLYKLRELNELLTCQNGYEPNDIELRDEYNKKYKKPISLKQVARLRQFFNNIVSLNQSVSAFNGEELYELITFLEDQNSNTEDEALSNIQYESLRKIINGEIESNLTDREKLILKLHYGIDIDAPLPLSKIGEIIGINRSRVNKIEYRALLKLLYHKDITDKEYIDKKYSLEKHF